MPRKLTKIEIVLCVLLGVALTVGLVSAFVGIAAVLSASLLCAVGLSTILVVKNGIRLGYIYSKSKFVGSDLSAIRGAVESLQGLHQKTGEDLLSIQKRCLVQGEQITLGIEVQNQANREQIRSIQDSARRQEEIRDELRKINDRLEETNERSTENRKLLEEVTSLNQERISSAVECGIDRSLPAISRQSEDLQRAFVTSRQEFLSKIDVLGSSVEHATSSILETTGAQIKILEAKLLSFLEELGPDATSNKIPDTSIRIEALSNSINAIETSLKEEIKSIRTGVSEIIISESSVEKISDVMAREGLQTRRQLRRHVTDTVRDSTRQVEAIAKLMPRLREINPLIPPTGGFALDAQALLHLIDILERERPSVLVEFGGGTSTIWMAYICREYNTRIISIDHLEQYLGHTEREVARHGFSDMVECRLAPLEPLEIDGTEYSWYSLSALSDLADVDFLFIDGPPESTGPNARRPAMHVMIEKLSSSAVVVLDDTHRESEQETIRNWISAYSGFEVVDEHLSRLTVLAPKRNQTLSP